MLFNASTTYAPGEPNGLATGTGAGQDVRLLGKYHFDQLKMPNVWVGLAGLGVIAYLVHRYSGRRR